MKTRIFYLAAFSALFQLTPAVPLRAEFKAGAAVVDVTPLRLPVLVNGSMRSRSMDRVKTRVNARSLALADGKEKIVIVVVDSCMIGRPLLDEAKALASKRTGVRPDRILISATHTHTAPSALGCLGTNADPAYKPFLRKKLVEAIVLAVEHLEPARVGFAKIDAAQYTALRRWIRRPDRIAEDPFGNKTVRANMHAARKLDDVTGESGPEDPDLTLISFQSKKGRPLAVLANFSMHYYQDQNISADYFGLYCEGLKKQIAPKSADGTAPFVGIMSHGCSGDIWRRDYTKSPDQWNVNQRTIDEYANGLLNLTIKALKEVRYRDKVTLAMAERRMTLKYRVPSLQRLEWAKRVVAEMGDRLPKTTREIYAREQVILHERQKTEIVVQALRIGDIGIATTPCETYAITGLKIKAASPLKHNMVIELANGGDGYIPPPEQHLFGGYNTWAARSAGLEVMAEPKITEAAIGLLEKVAGKPRRPWKLGDGPTAKAVLALKPLAYWRLNEFTGPQAVDATGQERHAVYEPAITYYLNGPRTAAFCPKGEINRAAHFVGGRLRAKTAAKDRYTLSMWIWNGMPNNGRDVTGWFFSRGPDHGLSTHGDHLGLGGKNGNAGKLIYMHGDDAKAITAGKTEIERWGWRHVALVRDGEKVRVYLDGKLEIEAKGPGKFPAGFDQCFFGGRSDNDSNWEGRLDEIAFFDRALTTDELSSLVVQ